MQRRAFPLRVFRARAGRRQMHAKLKWADSHNIVFAQRAQRDALTIDQCPRFGLKVAQQQTTGNADQGTVQRIHGGGVDTDFTAGRAADDRKRSSQGSANAVGQDQLAMPRNRRNRLGAHGQIGAIHPGYPRSAFGASSVIVQCREAS